MNAPTLLLAVGTAVLVGGMITLNQTVGQRKQRLGLLLKRATATTVVLALAGSVATAPQFYAHRPALVAYMGAPVIVGLIWTLYRYEAASPGRITGLVVQRRGPRRSSARQGRVVTRFIPSLRGWLTLAIFEDKAQWRFIHVGAIAAGWAAAAFLPPPPGWIAPWVIVLVSTTRWMRIQGDRSKIIKTVYAIAAQHLDYSKAVNSRLTGGGAAFAAPAGCIGVEWADLTTPIRITIAFPVTFAKTDLNKRNVFEDEFDATLPGAGWKFAWDTSATTVLITPAAYPTNVRWELRTPDGWSSFYVGDELDDGSSVTFNVQSESPHILVAGETGSGKTEAMFVIAAQALLKGWDVAICDPKETGWAGWTRRRRPTNTPEHDKGADQLRDGDGRPGVIEHAVEVYGIRDVLYRCKTEMQRRKKVNGAHKVVKWTDLPDEVLAEENMKPLMVVIDEALSLFDMKKGSTDEIKAENEARGEAMSLLQTLVVEARALGIHVLLGIQRPDAAVLSGAMRSNIGARIACGVMEPTGYQMMFQSNTIPRLVVRNPEGKKVIGRALVRSSPGQPIVPVQVAWLGDNQVDLDKVAPLPETPEQEDETPTGAFNPYVNFDDPTPWLNQHLGAASGPAPWETGDSGSASGGGAFDAIDQHLQDGGGTPPPWEQILQPEPPPWEIPAPNDESDLDDVTDDDVMDEVPFTDPVDLGTRPEITPAETHAPATGLGDGAWMTPTPTWSTPSAPTPALHDDDEGMNGWFASFLPADPPVTVPAVTTEAATDVADEEEGDGFW